MGILAENRFFNGKKIPAEDESETGNLDGEVVEYRDQETDSETDVEANPVHEEYSDSNSNKNVCIIHLINLKSYTIKIKVGHN
ncbi:hypothetical protein AVEN_235263-1 [Araneus ventricosus]|uniref:Uncharacterized protein n=1 Tax=Araneus ventricosus TaxID=182803 RepID=A0A4Y2A3H3_ARAVE|nr:hypothetical protein AVEN_235263-1 [Araneus ventricosus]